MVLEINMTSASLGTSCVFSMETWNLSHSKFMCLLALIITFVCYDGIGLMGHLRPTHSYHVVLMPQAFLLNRWMFGLAGFNNIVVRLQMAYQVILGGIGHITPINYTSKRGTIPCPTYTF